MRNVMTYKGYSARIEYDDEDGILFGQIAGIVDGVGFHAGSAEGLRQAFHEAVDDHIETCARTGKEPQKPYSGKMMFRVSPDVHRRAALAAENSGKSLNQGARRSGQGRRIGPGRIVCRIRWNRQPSSTAQCLPETQASAWVKRMPVTGRGLKSICS